MAPTLPEVPSYVFHAYLLHGMIRVAQFFAPDIKPWNENDSSQNVENAKESIKRHLRIYLGSSLFQLSSKDLEGLIIASGNEPVENKDLATQLIQSMTNIFWDSGSTPWLKYGIFTKTPDKDMIPCSFGAIVFEAMCCLIYHFQITFAYDPAFTLFMHDYHCNLSGGIDAVIGGVVNSFKDTFSREVLIFAQIGADELSDFYHQAKLFEEESDAWRYTFCLQMASNRILHYEDELSHNDS